jgi:toxin ParE1/3/4
LLDLEEIAEYIALDNPPAATRYVRKVFSAVARLKRYPNSGGRPEELPSTPYRELIVPPCRVFYRVKEDAVFVLHVMRSERLLRSFLLEQRDEDL